MITIATVCRTLPGLTEDDVRRFVAADWVRPLHRAGEPVFAELDLARIRLILDLRTTLDVEERTVPLVLSLLDQLYTLHRQLRQAGNQLSGES